MAKEVKPNETLALYRMHRKRVNERQTRELEKAVSMVALSTLQPVKTETENGTKVAETTPAPAGTAPVEKSGKV